MGGEFLLELFVSPDKVAAAAHKIYPTGWEFLKKEVFAPSGQLDLDNFHRNFSGRRNRTPEHQTVLLPALQRVQSILPKGTMIITVCDGWSGYGDADDMVYK